MKVLMIGDVVGKQGCESLMAKLPYIKKMTAPDLTIINGENASNGNGILPSSADDIFSAGADAITLGNHGLKRHEIYDYLDEHEAIIRPANLHSSAPGRGIYIFDKPGMPRTMVVNLLGVSFMDWHESPFDCMDRIISESDCQVLIVDMHAEATSEKMAMAFYLDGKASVLAGTHTHIQTADERILPGGLGYITDLGMCGSFNSVLGIKPELAIRRFRTSLPTRFDYETGNVRISGALFEIDNKTGKTVAIERINIDC